MRVISLSVDGMHQAAHNGLFNWLASQDADVICLQDLRAQEQELIDHPEFKLDGYFSYFFDSPTPHHNGIAIYTRTMPKAIMYGFGFSSGVDMDGRYLQADFDQLSIGSLLTPAGTASTESQDIKQRFFRDLQAHLGKISHKRRHYILCGNWNIAHTSDDLENAEAHADTSGFLAEERQWMSQIFRDVGYADAFRLGNSDTDEFSWWPSGESGKGDGWRTDLQVISKDLTKTVEYAMIYKAKSFSSHAPIIVDYDLELR